MNLKTAPPPRAHLLQCDIETLQLIAHLIEKRMDATVVEINRIKSTAQSSINYSIPLWSIAIFLLYNQVESGQTLSIYLALFVFGIVLLNGFALLTFTDIIKGNIPTQSGYIFTQQNGPPDTIGESSVEQLETPQLKNYLIECIYGYYINYDHNINLQARLHGNLGFSLGLLMALVFLIVLVLFLYDPHSQM